MAFIKQGERIPHRRAALCRCATQRGDIVSKLQSGQPESWRMVLCSPISVKLISGSSGCPLHRTGLFWYHGRYVNRRHMDSCTVMAGGRARFRAIMLTPLTTVAGLLPILLEKSFQAQFLVPMAISISFGLRLMGATLLVLILLPSLSVGA